MQPEELPSELIHLLVLAGLTLVLLLNRLVFDRLHRLGHLLNDGSQLSVLRLELQEPDLLQVELLLQALALGLLPSGLAVVVSSLPPAWGEGLPLRQ